MRIPSTFNHPPILTAVAVSLLLVTSGCPGEDPPVAPTSDATADASADGTTGDANADADSGQPDAAPDATPDATPDGTPDATPDATPDGIGDASDVLDDVAIDGGGDVADAGDTQTDAPQDVGGDGTVFSCSPECEAGFVCAPGGNCVKDCSLEYPAFDQQAVFNSLASGWDVVGMHCGGNLSVSAFEPLSATTVLELVGTDGAPDSMLDVDSVTFDTVPTIENVTTYTITGSIDAFETFPGLRLKADATGEVFGYGYTGAFDVANLFSPGEILFGSLLAPGAPTAIEGSSNYDLDEMDKDNWLISSRSVNNVGTEAGVYWLDLAGGNIATRVAGGLGFASGNVAVDGDIVILGGFADPWPADCGGTPASGGVGNKVFYTTVTALTAAKASVTPIDTYCDAQELDGIGSDFSFLDNGRLISANVFEDKWLTLHYLEVDGGGTMTVPTSIPIATNATLQVAKGVPNSDGQVMIQTSTGYMLIAPNF